MMDWFEVAHKLATKLYPCQRCYFALARYGKIDPIFGVGFPKLCPECIADYPDEQWYKIKTTDYYNANTQTTIFDRYTQEVIKELDNR